MIFKEGLLYAYKNRKTDGEISDPFYLYCRLSDLCASSYVDKKKVELFYAIDKRLCIFETLIKKGEKGKEELLNSYLVVSELLGEESFIKLIDCAVWVMSSSACMPKPPPPKPKSKEPPQATPKGNTPNPPPKPTPAFAPVQPVVVNRAAESVQQQTRTPLRPANYYFFDETEIFWAIVGVLLIASLIVGLFGLLVGVCGWDIPWLVWQWIIGIVGGGWLALGIGLLIYLLDDAIVCDYYLAGLFSMLAVLLVNCILVLILRENYKAIFGCLCGWEIIGCGVMAYICFDDIESEWGVGYIIGGVVVLLIMLACLIWL